MPDAQVLCLVPSDRSFSVGDILVLERTYDCVVPTRYFKVLRVDPSFGVVYYYCRGERNTIGVANIHKANALQKILYHLYYRHLGPEGPRMWYVRWRVRRVRNRIRSKFFAWKYSFLRFVSSKSKSQDTSNPTGVNNGQR